MHLIKIIGPEIERREAIRQALLELSRSHVRAQTVTDPKNLATIIYAGFDAIFSSDYITPSFSRLNQYFYMPQSRTHRVPAIEKSIRIVTPLRKAEILERVNQFLSIMVDNDDTLIEESYRETLIPDVEYLLSVLAFQKRLPSMRFCYSSSDDDFYASFMGTYNIAASYLAVNQELRDQQFAEILNFLDDAHITYNVVPSAVGPEIQIQQVIQFIRTVVDILRPQEFMPSHISSSLSIPASILDPMYCPLSCELMRDPVSAADGHTYERANIMRWFDQGRNTSPLTGLPLPNRNLTPNPGIRAAIEGFREARPANSGPVLSRHSFS